MQQETKYSTKRFKEQSGPTYCANEIQRCTHPDWSGLRKVLMAAGSSDFKMNMYDDMAAIEQRESSLRLFAKTSQNKHTKHKMPHR